MTTLLYNALANYAGFAVRAGAALVLTPVLIHHLGDTAFGLWMLLLTLGGWFQLLELGLCPAVIHHSARRPPGEDPAALEALLGAGLSWLLLALIPAAAAWAGLGWFGPDWFDLDAALLPGFHQALPPLALALTAAFFKRFAHALLEGHQRFQGLNLVSVITTLAAMAATLLLLPRNPETGVAILAWILAAQNTVEALLLGALCHRWLGLRFSPLRATRAAWQRLWSFSLPAFLADMAVLLAHRVDVLVISLFLPLGAITPFTIGQRLGGLLEKAVDPLIQLFFPLAARWHGSDDLPRLRTLLLQGTRFTLLMVTPGLVWLGLNGAEVLRWWVGTAWVADALPVLWVFLGIVWVAVAEATAGRLLLGMGQVRFDARVSSLGALANVALSLVLVHPLGILGVALGTLVPVAAVNLLWVLPYACRQVGLPMRQFLGALLPPLLLAALLPLGLWGLIGLGDPTPLALGLQSGVITALLTLGLLGWYRLP
ncbi:MAG: oligosaccharide flippase family protein [Magnetococcus sp. WYHC-3]